jgi:hypothetical protein
MMIGEKSLPFRSVISSRGGLVDEIVGPVCEAAKRIRAHIKESVSKPSDALLVSLLMVLIGVFYVTTLGPGHNWGGDFSQYILHARNIALSRPYDQTGYIQCPYDPSLGPSVYPPGFPILLSPVYSIFGLSFAAFKIEVIIFLLLSLTILWFSFRDGLSRGYRIALLGLFAFSPWMISFKENVLSDIPFLFFIYLSFAYISRLYKRGDFRFGSGALLIVLILFSSLVRTPGMLLIFAFLTHDVYQNKSLSRFSILFASSSITLVLASRLLFPGEATYLAQMDHWSPHIILDNLIDYAKELSLFWPKITPSPYSTIPVFLLASSFALWGLVLAIKGHRLSVAEFFLISYLALILIWPSRQGMRFLLPFIPLYLTYLLVGVDDISRLLKAVSARAIFLGILSIVALISYGLGLQMTIRKLELLPDGPFTAHSTELFSYVKEHTDPGAVFVFRKPRVLSLFTNRSATIYPCRDDDTSLAYFADVGVTQVIVDLEDDEDRMWLVPLVARNPAAFRKVFENARFVVFDFDCTGADIPVARCYQCADGDWHAYTY